MAYRCIVDDPRSSELPKDQPNTPPWYLELRQRCGRSTAGKKPGEWYRGILEAAERFMVKWHEVETQLSRQRHASAVGGAQGNGGRGGATAGVEGNPTKRMWVARGQQR